MVTKKADPLDHDGDGKKGGHIDNKAGVQNDTVVSSAGDTELVLRKAPTVETKVQKAGEAGPKSSLETKVGSTTGASAGEARNFEGNVVTSSEGKAQDYDVQCHTDEKGVFVKRFSAESGDEAANKALKMEGYKGLSIRGVTPASDPDPNSLGGERDASIMIADAQNEGAIINTLGTEANAEATRELRKKDIEELGE